MWWLLCLHRRGLWSVRQGRCLLHPWWNMGAMDVESGVLPLLRSVPSSDAVSSAEVCGGALPLDGRLCESSVSVDIHALPSVSVCGPVPPVDEAAEMLRDRAMRDRVRPTGASGGGRPFRRYVPGVEAFQED